MQQNSLAPVIVLWRIDDFKFNVCSSIKKNMAGFCTFSFWIKIRRSSIREQEHVFELL